MGKYIRQFATAAEQAAAPEINPAVDWIKETDEVVYTPYEPPFTGKVKLTYSDGSVYTAACDSNTTLTTANTKPSGYMISAMTSAEIGSCITSIGNNAFANCSSLTSIALPSGVTSLGDSAFIGCSSLTSINIPSGVTTIVGSTFRLCTGVTSVTIPNSVTSIADFAFGQCYSLTSISIPSGVTVIDVGTFDACRSLTSIIVPSAVTNIKNGAFTHCTGLTSVTILATTPPTLGTNVFYDTNNSPIYVPAASVDAYKSAWSDYANRIQAIPTT